MSLIRIFKTSQEAQLAKKILEESGIACYVSEDKFNNVPIQEFGVRARFRLTVADKDYNKAAMFIAQKLRRNRLK